MSNSHLISQMTSHNKMSHSTSQIAHLDLRLAPPLSLGSSCRAHTLTHIVLLCLIEWNIALSPRLLSYSPSYLGTTSVKASYLSLEPFYKFYDFVVKLSRCIDLLCYPVPSLSNLIIFSLLPFTETLMDTKWATTELAWTAHPETGVSLRGNVCVFVSLWRLGQIHESIET